jgi:hypothetical protein
MSDNVSVGTPAAPAATGSDNLISRLVGVIFSPRDTFTKIVARPAWAGALGLVTVIIAVLSYVFLSTEVGQSAWLDQQVRQTEAFSGAVTEQQYTMFEAMAPTVRYWGAGFTLLLVPIFNLIIAGILLAVFNALLGGSASFKQVAAVLAHSGAVSIVQQIFIFPLNYARESMSSATNLGLLVPFLDEGNLLARFLGTIDLFIIWWLVVLAIGIGVLFRRKTAPIFWSFMGVYVVIALVIALVMRGASGGA